VVIMVMYGMEAFLQGACIPVGLSSCQRFASPPYYGRRHRRVAPGVTQHDHGLCSMQWERRHHTAPEQVRKSIIKEGIAS